MSEPDTPDGGSARPAPEQDPAAALRAMLLNPRAFFDASVAPLLFVTVNAFTGLGTAAAAAGGWGLGLAIYRLVRRHEVRQAVAGLAGLGIAVLIALRTGRASSYFVPGVVMGGVLGVALVLSVVAGRPLSSFVARAIEGKPREHYRERAVRNSHTVVTLAWALVTLGRAAYRAVLVAQDRPVALGVATVLMGWPVTAAFVVASVAFLRWRGHAGRQPADHAD